MSITPPDVEQARAGWEGVAAPFDEHVTPRTSTLGRQIVERLGVGPGTRLLDVGAGSGAVALAAARAGADVIANDLALGMLERLAARAGQEGLANVRTLACDAVALDLPDHDVEVAVSLNGVSVVPDLEAGLREMVRVTRPGGRVAVAAFGPMAQVEFIAFPLAALASVVPGFAPPSSGPLPPFRLAEPAAFADRLRGVGLDGVAVTDLDWQVEVSSGEDLFRMFLSSNPIARSLVAGLGQDQHGEVCDVLDGMLRDRTGARPAQLHGKVLLGTGLVP